MLVPQMKKRADRYFLRGVVSRTGTQGSNFARDNEVEVLTSDLDEVLRRSGVSPGGDRDAASRARRSGRSIARRPASTCSSRSRWRSPGTSSTQVVERLSTRLEQQPLLMVGFNRRFSPALQTLKERLTRPPGAAGDPVPAERRLHSARPLGARRAGRRPQHRRSVPHVRRVPVADRIARRARSTATSIDPGALPYLRNDNFAATIGYEDGSVATLIYTALGPKTGLGKERIDVFCDGEAFVVDDFKKLTRASDGAVLWQSGEAGQGPLRGAEPARRRDRRRRAVADFVRRDRRDDRRRASRRGPAPRTLRRGRAQSSDERVSVRRARI